MDRTDVIDEGVGRVVIKSTRAPPSQRLPAWWRDVRRWPTMNPTPTPCQACRRRRLKPRSPTPTAVTYATITPMCAPGNRIQEPTSGCGTFWEKPMPPAGPARSRRLRPRSSAPRRHRPRPDSSDAQRLRRRFAAAMGRTRTPTFVISADRAESPHRRSGWRASCGRCEWSPLARRAAYALGPFHADLFGSLQRANRRLFVVYLPNRLIPGRYPSCAKRSQRIGWTRGAGWC